MCITAAATIASTAFGAYSAFSASAAAKSQAQHAANQHAYNAQVADNNALIASQNAARIGQVGEQRVAEHRRRIIQGKGSARASAASRGVALGSDDSSVNTQLEDIAQFGRYDILKIRDGIAAEKRNAHIQGINFQTEAAAQRLSASGARSKASGFNPALDLIGTATGSVAQNSEFYRSIIG